MLAIGRALVTNPKLLLLDEPSPGLVPIVASKVFESIRKLRDLGTTILLVEQQVHQALKIADRAYVLENGKTILHGVGKDLLSEERVKKAYLDLT